MNINNTIKIISITLTLVIAQGCAVYPYGGVVIGPHPDRGSYPVYEQTGGQCFIEDCSKYHSLPEQRKSCHIKNANTRNRCGMRY